MKTLTGHKGGKQLLRLIYNSAVHKKNTVALNLAKCVTLWEKLSYVVKLVIEKITNKVRLLSWTSGTSKVYDQLYSKL